MTSREKFILIGKICDRIEKCEIPYNSDRLSACMDLEYSNVNLIKLLDSDVSTFTHDIAGIFANMDRTNAKLSNCFVPRVGFNS